MSLLTGKVNKPSTHAQPQSRKELEQLIYEHIAELNPRPGQEVDFNWIDISEVDDLSGLFANVDFNPVIDKWHVSNVKDMSGMFERCPFDGKNGDISNWKVSKGTNMRWMFADCPLENNPPKWYKDK